MLDYCLHREESHWKDIAICNYQFYLYRDNKHRRNLPSHSRTWIPFFLLTAANRKELAPAFILLLWRSSIILLFYHLFYYYTLTVLFAIPCWVAAQFCMTDRLLYWHSPWRACAWCVSVMFLVLLVNLPSYVLHGRTFGARSSPGLKQSGELLCWSWWMWGGLHELKTHLCAHPPASQALSTSTAMANSHDYPLSHPSLCPSPPQPLAPLSSSPALPAPQQSTSGCLCFALNKV